MSKNSKYSNAKATQIQKKQQTNETYDKTNYIGKQYNSRKQSYPTWGFPKADRSKPKFHSLRATFNPNFSRRL